MPSSLDRLDPLPISFPANSNKPHFHKHIRAYSQMFAMTSFRAKVDDSVNKGRGPYVFKISGQIYHWIGSLCPEEGLYGVVSRGDRKGIAVDSKIILPRTFTGRPRYMYCHYLDALTICRSLGNPQFFITFTCNVKWPKIKRYMAQYPELTPADRADVVCRVFEQKVKDFVSLNFI
ncbi:DNA helicase [Tanacetum coccineum]